MDINKLSQGTSAYNPMATTAAVETKASNEKGIMQKDDFLKLFLASLQYQDPNSPMETKDMMAQMTQLGTMEQMTNMSTIMEDLKEIMAQEDTLEKGVDFLGKDVSGVSTEGVLVSGVVDEVAINDGKLQLMIQEKSIDLASVWRVADYTKYGAVPAASDATVN